MSDFIPKEVKDVLNQNDISSQLAPQPRKPVKDYLQERAATHYVMENERLRAENARLREATLEEAAQEIERVGHNDYPNKLITDGYAFAVRSLKTRAARAAMRET